MNDSLEKIRDRAERFYQELEKEYYLEGAGLKEQVNAAEIYDRYADLASRSLLEYLRVCAEEAAAAAAHTDLRRITLMMETAVQTFLTNGVQKETDALLTIEATGFIDINDGRGEIGFREAAVRLMNEPDRARRRMIAAARDRFTVEKLNPLYRQIVETVHRMTREIGYTNYREMVQQVSSINLMELHAMTGEFLSDTEQMYEDVLGWFTQKELGIPLGELERHDLAFLSRATRFDRFFPPDLLMENIMGFVRKMGIDPTAGGHILLDIDPRARKSPRAFCSPVRIPDEVYLVIMPAGGVDDYRAFLHELGHALHYAHVSPELEWEYKRLGDNSVTEGFAMCFDHLLHDRLWLKKVMKISQPDDFIKHAHLMELMMLRRYAAKLSYELFLHDGQPLEGKEEVYAEVLTHATKARHTSAQYLADVDPFFYCARYLRAWMLQSILHQYLRENFDEDWFINPRTGEFLIELWSQGQRFNAEEFARQLAYPSLTMEFMKETIEQALGR
jgi:hypothetical protein